MGINMMSDSITNYYNKEEMKSVIYSMYKETAENRGLTLDKDLEKYILNQVDTLMEAYDVKTDLNCFQVPLGEDEYGKELFTKPLMYLEVVEEVLAMFQRNLAKMFLHILALEIDKYIEHRDEED
jgi:hypothetical protein